jgi:hypothetical protein
MTKKKSAGKSVTTETALTGHLDEDLREAWLDELVIFLKREANEGDFKMKAVSKTKFSHTFKLIHRDQVMDTLTNVVREAYETID